MSEILEYNDLFEDVILTFECNSTDSAEWIEHIIKKVNGESSFTSGTGFCSFFEALGRWYPKKGSQINGICYKDFYEYVYARKKGLIKDCFYDPTEDSNDPPAEMVDSKTGKTFIYVGTRVPKKGEIYRFGDNHYLSVAKHAKNEYPIYKEKLTVSETDNKQTQEETTKKETDMPKLIFDDNRTGRVEVIMGYEAKALTPDDCVKLLSVAKKDLKDLEESPAAETKYIQKQIKEKLIVINKLVDILNK